MWYRQFTVSVSHCPVDITWFPYDAQLCDLVYESRTHESKELTFTKMLNAVVLDYYNSNSEWQLTGTSRKYLI